MRGDVIGGAVVPLTDALPWSFIITDNNNNNNNKCNSSTTTGSNRNGSRTILINDAMDTDGRFLLYTIVSQILTPPTSSPKARATTHHNNSSSNHGNKTGSATKSTLKNNGRVLWLGCGSVTEGQILTGLKRWVSTKRFFPMLRTKLPPPPLPTTTTNSNKNKNKRHG